MYKVAVIEDDLPILEMYKHKLVADGFNVKTAQNGRIGLDLCGDFHPDLILLDLNLPEMNGTTMLKKLRETDWGASIRVIILTNASKAEAPSELRLLNVERYIMKAHHTPRQVIDVVKEVLGEPKVNSI